MGVLFFSSENKGPGEKVQRIIEAAVPADEIEIYRTTESIGSRFKQLGKNPAIMVLLAASLDDLQGLLLIRDLFSDIPIILILPDREKETILKGHKFYPRFVSYVDSDFQDVALVLRRMIDMKNTKASAAEKVIEKSNHSDFQPGSHTNKNLIS